MERILLILACTVLSASAWSVQHYPPRRAPMRFTRYAPAPPHLQQRQQHRIPIADVEEPQWNRPKRGHDDYDHKHGHQTTGGVTGSVHSLANMEDSQWNRPKRGHDDYDHKHGHQATGGVTGSVHSLANVEDSQWNRPKRGHDDFDHYDHRPDHGHGHKATSGVTGPVHTFVKTDKNANYKWGVRHHVGDKYAS